MQRRRSITWDVKRQSECMVRIGEEWCTVPNRKRLDWCINSPSKGWGILVGQWKLWNKKWRHKQWAIWRNVSSPGAVRVAMEVNRDVFCRSGMDQRSLLEGLGRQLSLQKIMLVMNRERPWLLIGRSCGMRWKQIRCFVSIQKLAINVPYNMRLKKSVRSSSKPNGGFNDWLRAVQCINGIQKTYRLYTDLEQD